MTEIKNLTEHNNPDETSIKYMLKLATPMIVTTVSFTIMQFIDRFMVSLLGTDALAAILPAGFVSFVPASFAMAAIISVNTFVSQSLGRGEKDRCANYCWQSIYMGLAYFLVVLSIMWPTAPAIFKILGHPAEVVELEVIYLRIMLYAQFMTVLVWSSSQFFMGIHKPIIIMYAALVSQIVNITANYILIFGKFGFPAMGIAGAGWGTFVGVSFGAGIRMAMYLSPKIHKEYKSRRIFRIDFLKIRDLLKVGFPAGIGFMINMAAWAIILFGLAGKFGKEALAATSAVFSCMNFSFMPIVGLGMALTAAVGKSIGKERKDIAIKQTGICLRVALIYMGFVGLCFLLFRKPLMGFWSSDDKVIEIGVKIFVFASVFQIFDAFVITYNDALRGAGDTLWLAMVEAVAASVIMGLGGLCMLFFFPQFGVMGAWFVATLKIIMVAYAYRWRFKSNRWMEIDLFKRRPVSTTVEMETIID
ncbi:MAG: MATE family efflux transporter [Planctomycetota bacterium]|jgi:MATE family multidrug resistance protein